LEIRGTGQLALSTILCIDDEELGLEIRKMVLELEGYRVLTARDGRGGLRIFKSQQVDAVVIDFSLPGLDGGQVAARMRALRPEVPILMLSAYVTLPESVMQVVDLSATKGDGASDLAIQLKALLRGRNRGGRARGSGRKSTAQPAAARGGKGRRR
jgi:DNA-binding response OmpR family regulator